MQAAMQRTGAAPTPVPAEDFGEQIVEKNNQHWSAFENDS